VVLVELTEVLVDVDDVVEAETTVVPGVALVEDDVAVVSPGSVLRVVLVEE